MQHKELLPVGSHFFHNPPPPKYYIFEANVDKYRAPFEIM